MSDDFGFVAPDLTAETGEKITYLEGAYVVPPPDEGVNRSVQNSGVLDAEGRHVENSITWRGVNPVTRAPAMPAPETVADLPGTSALVTAPDGALDLIAQSGLALSDAGPAPDGFRLLRIAL